MNIGQTIQNNSNICLTLARKLIDGIDSSSFSTYAKVAGHVIHSNHPAFAYGHLAIYPNLVLSQLEKDPVPFPSGTDFDSLFSPTQQCQDDPKCTIYPSMELITDYFFEAYRVAGEAVAQTSDDVLNQANPHPRMKDRFPTLASAHTHLLSAHIMLHLGQVSAWRRMIGLPPA